MDFFCETSPWYTVARTTGAGDGTAQQPYFRPQVQVLLYEQVTMRTEGCLSSCDKYVNLVLADPEDGVGSH